jgi:signal transduction histidine kinase
MAVLNELGQALTARLDVEQVLDEAFRGASRLLDTTNFYVALSNPEQDEVTFAIDVTEGELRKPYVTRQAGQGLTEYIIRNRTPLLIEEDMPERLEEMGIELIGPVALSWLGVPLMIADRVLGVMAVQSYTTPHAYSEHDRGLLTAIASQAAIAIQNAHLFEETRSRAERLAVVNRIASAASATLNLDELMETVYQEIVPAFQADAFFIALYDQQANELDFCFQVDEGVREPPERLPLGTGLASLVVTNKEPLVIGDDEERERLSPSPHLFGTMKPATSWLGAPMLVGERVIGVVSVQAYRPRAWDEEDQLLLFTIADQVAVALENARLFAQAEQRMQELEALYQADEQLYRHLNLDQVLEALMDVAMDILQADKCSLMELDAQREKLVVRAARGFSPETVAQMVFSLGEGSVGRVLASGERAIVEDTHTEPHVARRITEPEGIRSFMHVPIKIGGQMFGVFNVDYIEPRAFGEEVQRLFTALAQRAALAIENAQLYEQAQQAATLEERQRLARELHDSVTQALYGVTLYGEAAARLLSSGRADLAADHLRELRDTAHEALREMRLLIFELRPPLLEQEGLIVALQARLEAVEGRAGLKTAFNVEGEVHLPPEIEQGLYRIGQEALNNALKHARARSVAVSLHQDQRAVILEITDDGMGFDLATARESGGLGLRGMKERAAQLGGQLTVKSEPGAGTSVRVEVNR